MGAHAALPLFALTALLLSIAWRTLRSLLDALEQYAAQLLARGDRGIAVPHAAAPVAPPRSLFGGAFASHPPPATD